MIYRLDYLLAVIFAGGFLGAVLERRTSPLPAARLALVFYRLTAACTVLAAIFFTCSVLTNRMTWNVLSAGVSDISNLLLGGVLGLAVFRSKRWDLLREPDIYSACCLSVAIFFMTAGVGKAFHMEEATQFFLQSAYPAAFLKLIVITEVLGGAALLLPWTRSFAIVGLSIDAFGAIYTHLHHGDTIHEAKDAFSMVIALGVIAFAWALQPGQNISTHHLRWRVIRVAVGIPVFAMLGVLGGILVRHSSHVSPEGISRDAKPTVTISCLSPPVALFVSSNDNS